MSSKKKRKSPCSFASLKKPSTSKAFEFIRYIVRAGRKLKTKAKTNLQTQTQESWSNNCCRQSLARKSREISFLPVLSRGCYFVEERFRKLRAWFILDLGSCPVKTSIAPRGIRAKISLLTLLRERRNSDLAKDILLQEQHLSPLCN